MVADKTVLNLKEHHTGIQGVYLHLQIKDTFRTKHNYFGTCIGGWGRELEGKVR